MFEMVAFQRIQLAAYNISYLFVLESQLVLKHFVGSTHVGQMNQMLDISKFQMSLSRIISCSPNQHPITKR